MYNNDKYIEVKYNNDYIVFDTVPNEDYITINRIDDLFTHIYLHNKKPRNAENTVSIPDDFDKLQNDINIISSTLPEKVNNYTEKIEAPTINETIKIQQKEDQEVRPDDADDAEEEEEDDDDDEEEDINNQISEYKDELLMIETEINIINNIIFNIKASNGKSIFNLNKFKTRLFNKNSCDSLMCKIKNLCERKKIIENTINDIYKLMKTYEN